MTKSFDKLPFVARLLLIIFLGWLIGGIYRIVRWTEKKNTATLVVGILGLFTAVGNIVIEVIDLVTTILGNGICFFAD